MIEFGPQFLNNYVFSPISYEIFILKELSLIISELISEK